MTIQYNLDLLERFIVPGISKFEKADIPDLQPQYNQHPYWLTNYFLNCVFSAQYKPPMQQYAFNAIYRTQMAFKDYHEARDLTHSYLINTKPDNPTIRQYFEALSRWESCILNWQILVDLYNKMFKIPAFKKLDKSPDQRAYTIANNIKHWGSKINNGDAAENLTVPLWLMNDGFNTLGEFLSYEELSLLMSQAAQLADEIQNPKAKNNS